MARHQAKLTPDDVRLIRQLHAEGLELKRQADALTVRAIAAKFGVGPSAISDICRFVTWVDVR
jgi:hypothetical protein